MRTVLVVGNPRPSSRTSHAGRLLVEALTGAEPDSVIELSEYGAELFDWESERVSLAVRSAAEADLVVFASPTFKATYTALLKLFLERYTGGTGLRGVVAVPLMIGGSPAHSLAPEVSLKPVLSEIGATCALPGLYLIDSAFTEDGVIAEYAERWRPVIEALTSAR